MNKLSIYIQEKLNKTKSSLMLEKLKINSKSKVDKLEYKYHPTTQFELIKIVNDRIQEEHDNIDFNDIDTSNIKTMIGIFSYHSKLTKIDISEWDVSNVISMAEMFSGSKKLESIGDISDWKINNLDDITAMFYGCKKLTNTGDLNKWDASGIINKRNAFTLANENIIPKWA